MKLEFKYWYFYIVILLYGLLFLLPFSGSIALLDWDEIIFAESAREMIRSGDYQTVTIAYQPFWEKPPMFIWFQVISMKLFGINEFAARFPNVVCGMLTLLSLFLFGRKVYDKRFGMIWAMVHGTAVLPFFYFRTGLIDPWFNLFILNGICFFLVSLDPGRFPRQHLNVSLSAFFIGLAVLTKGPVALLVFVLCFFIFLVLKKGRLKVKPSHVLLFILVLAVTGGSWFLVSVLKGNIQVVKDFISYQAGLFSEDFAGHSGFPGFHFVILLLGVFPASALLFTGITKKREDSELAHDFRRWMYILLAIVLVLFSVVETKLVHYSSLAYFPVTYLAAWVVFHWLERKREISRWLMLLILLLSICLVLLLAAVPYLMLDPSRFTRLFPGLLSPHVSGVLSTEAGWGYVDFLPAFLLLAGTILSLLWIRKRERKGIFALHAFTLAATLCAMLLFVPKVEKMVQGPSIEFAREHSGENEHVISLGFKSFAPYYYGRWDEADAAAADPVNWDLPSTGIIYVVMKADNSSKVLERYPEVKKTGEKGGFVFGVIEKSSTK